MSNSITQGITHSSFGHDVEKYVQPFREEGSTSFSQIQAADSPQFDAETLQEDCEDIRHQDNEKKLEAIRRAGSNIS
jgi:hypothetical protein